MAISDKTTTESPITDICTDSTEKNTSLTSSEINKRYEEYLDAAHADNTRSSYTSACNHFERWGGRLPTDKDTLIRYLIEYAESLNPRTLELRISAISKWHTTQQFHNPTNDPTVRAILLGIKRKHGKPKVKAKALRLEHLASIIRYLQNQPETLKNLRDQALIQIGYFGAFRRSELVGINVEDITWEPEGISIQLPRSKTDQTGEGMTRTIIKGTEKICPVTALEKWLTESGIETGHVFRSINRWGDIRDNLEDPSKNALYPGTVTDILKSIAKSSGLDFTDQLSSHSLRSGITTSAARENVNFRDIKKQGGWKSDSTVWEYIEAGQAFENNSSKIVLKALDDLICNF